MTATQDLIPDEPATLLGVVTPPDNFDEDAAAEAPMTAPTPLDEAAVAIRRAAERVTVQLATLREARQQINDEIRDLVVEDERLKRLMRVLNAK
jgi:hypothetical protein